MEVRPAPRGRNPFDTEGVELGADGIERYADRPRSLVEMLSDERRARCRRGVAVAEVGGPSVTYGELWERASRVAGGLRAAGLDRGDRAAILLAETASTGCWPSGAPSSPGVVAVPVNTRFKEAEVEYVVSDSGAAYVFSPGAALPDGEPRGRRRPRARRPRCDLLHERDHGLPEGRDDLARELPREYRERLPLRRRRQGRGTGAGDADQRAALPRHRLQLASCWSCSSSAAASSCSPTRSTSRGSCGP